MQEMNRGVGVSALVAALLSFAGCFGPKAGENGYVDEEGFTWLDGSQVDDKK